MDDSNVPIFAQAQLEYTKQLVDVWYMNMYDIVRESKVVSVFCSWYGSHLGKFYTPKKT